MGEKFLWGWNATQEHKWGELVQLNTCFVKMKLPLNLSNIMQSPIFYSDNSMAFLMRIF